MQKPERSSYTPLDFLSWHESGSLNLTPKFQRRGVWKTPARSHLIDTLVRGMPVPPIYLRISQSTDRKRIIREVIDGQQRISAIIDFVTGKYALSRNLGVAYGGKYFEGLSDVQQDAIRGYTFTCELFSSISDIEVLEVFSRLNTYSFQLTAQELRNGKFFGPFKQSAYSLGTEHLEFWRRNRIFTEQNIARMGEAELVSELIVMQIDGFQDKKKSLDTFYENFDQSYPDRKENESRFRSVIDVITESLEEVLAKSEFRRTPLFYTLFAAIFHRMYGIPREETPSPRKKRISKAESQQIRDTVLSLSEKIVIVKNDESVPKSFLRFINASTSQTDNLKPRQIRFAEFYRRAFS